MAHRHEVQKKAHGGEVRPALSYGNKDVAEAAFKKGSNPGIKAIQKKDGGKVPGRASGGRLDKRARGGGIKKVSAFKRGGCVEDGEDGKK